MEGILTFRDTLERVGRASPAPRTSGPIWQPDTTVWSTDVTQLPVCRAGGAPDVFDASSTGEHERSWPPT